MFATVTQCCRRAGARGFATASSDALYLGLDSSTQGLKATAIDGNFKVVSAFAINYQKDLPHYELKNGVHASAGNVVTQPTLMVRCFCCLPAGPPPPPPAAPALTAPPPAPRSTWRRWTCCFPR